MAVVAMLVLWQGVAVAQVKITAPQVVCNDVAEVSATLPQGCVGMWSSPMGNIQFSNPTFYETEVTGLQQGKNIIFWTVHNPETQMDSEVYAMIESIQLKADVLNKIEDEVCIDECELWAGNLPWNVVGFWTSNNPEVVIDCASYTTTTARNLAEGENIFTWTVADNEGQCTESKSIKVYNKSVLAKISDQTTTITCDGSCILEAEELKAGCAGYWSVVDPNSNVVFDNPAEYIHNILGLRDGVTTFRWTVTNGTCQSSAEVNVTYDNVLAHAFAAEEVVCSDECRLMSVLPEHGTGFWSCANEDLIDNPTASDIVVRNLAKGENFFTWTVTSGNCISTQELVVYNSSVEADVLNLDGEVVKSNECELQGVLSDGEKGYWTTCNSKIEIEEVSGKMIAKNLVNGDNCFTWNVISADGKCSSSHELKIVSNPNGDNVETPVNETIAAANTQIYSVDNLVVVENGGKDIQIAETSGRIVKNVKTNNQRVEIPIATPGIYIVKTLAKTQKVIIR